MRDDRHRLEQIAETGDRLMRTMQQRSITREIVMDDGDIQWMLTTPLIHIGEQANRLSDAITDRYPDIPWPEIAGLRHRLVHDYEDTNWTIICSVVFDQLPLFIESVKSILENL